MRIASFFDFQRLSCYKELKEESDRTGFFSLTI